MNKENLKENIKYYYLWNEKVQKYCLSTSKKKFIEPLQFLNLDSLSPVDRAEMKMQIEFQKIKDENRNLL